jgi:hypothetical protein
MKIDVRLNGLIKYVQNFGKEMSSEVFTWKTKNEMEG